MAIVKLSSKGQMVLPKEIREDLGLDTGAVLQLTRKGHKIILEPVAASMIDRLYGKFAGKDFLKDLEAEHRREILHENRS
jgi:AbrB family looped-hinge helix DNA binding protein